MKKALSCLGVVVVALSGMATDSRILTLGRHDAFFMDDYSIFRNPANLSIYPNMLMGSLGYYAGAKAASKNDSLFGALKRENRDPVRPYAGGIISYSFNQSSEAGSQYPMISLGVVLNRYDKMIDYLIPGTNSFSTAFSNVRVDTSTIPSPVGKLDLMAGYAFKDGGMIGVGGYFAFQNGYEDNNEGLRSLLYKGTIGVNWPVAKSTDLEASMGVGAITVQGLDTNTARGSIVKLADFSENRDFLMNADLRLFSALMTINGDFVPHLGLDVARLSTYNFARVAMGLGVNINVDKGFGWGAFEFIHEQTEKRNDRIGGNEITRGSGGRISFGFERNIWVDWLLLRAGFSKQLLFVTDNEGNRGRWEETVEADASDNDMIGVGFGLNIENRLKIDWVVAEDFFHTLTNLISGPQSHLFTRFTFTYSF